MLRQDRRRTLNLGWSLGELGCHVENLDISDAGLFDFSKHLAVPGLVVEIEATAIVGDGR